MAIEKLEQAEIEQVSGAGLLGAVLYPLGVNNPEGLAFGGGGTLGFGGAVRGLFTQLNLLGLGQLIILGESML